MDMTKIDTKSNKWLSQKKRVFHALFKRPMTRLEVSSRTQTPIQNVCRYVSQFKATGSLIILKKDRCSISKMPAEVISTNPAYSQKKQLNFFE
jgi:hypothetical protein